VGAFKEQVRKSDALLLAINEHDYSNSAALQNAVDGGARPFLENVRKGKPTDLLSFSVGRIGGPRTRCLLRAKFVWPNGFPINQPEVGVPFAPKGIDETGKLIDDGSRKPIADPQTGLARCTGQLQGRV